MSFIEQYVHSLNANSLQDDDTHYAAEALFAAAVADATGAGLGALLSRVKYADGSISKVFESGTANLANLLRIWGDLVACKGQERRWIKVKAEWDISTAPAFYKRVADRSLAYWLDGKCKDCNGTGVTLERRVCPTCKGSKQEEIAGNGYERARILDMVSELEGYLQAHNARAAARMRRMV